MERARRSAPIESLRGSMRLWRILRLEHARFKGPCESCKPSTARRQPQCRIICRTRLGVYSGLTEKLGEGEMKQTFAIGIGGAAGQGIATPGDIFAKIFSRRGLHLNAYNAYQSIIRGGHAFLTIRAGPEKVTNMGDRVDLLNPLNQDTMDRHLRLLTAGGACIYNSDTIHPGPPADGRQLCALPVSKLADITRNKVAQNTLAIGAGLNMMGISFQA